MPKRILAGLFAACLLLSGGGYSAQAQQVAGAQQAGACVGTVIDTNGDPVIGASVKVVGTTIGTMTDIDGKFSLTGVKKGAKVAITAIGYGSAEQVWDGSALSFTLKETDTMLDEMVVVGYGVQKKANVTGAVSTMNASAIENRTVASVSAAMAGEMPGVVVVQSSGAPGSQTGNITIRGNNSVNSASPLVIVDGVPGSMNNIDVQDIETLTVLKDAASAAIYGVQAANGVILITTKQGKLNTAASISYSGSVSWTKPTTKLDPVNAKEYDMMMREALLLQNPNNNVSQYDTRLAKYQSGELNPEGTDWYDETFKSHGFETAHTVQINGGSANTTYMASLGYLYQGGILDQNNYNRYNGRVNLDSKIRPWISAGVQMSFYRGIQKDGWNGVSGIMQHVNRLNATLSPYDENGDYVAPGSMQNPLAERDNATGIYKVKNDQLATNIYLNITPIKGLSIRPLFSWRHDYRDYYRFRKVLSYGGTYNGGDNGSRRGEHNHYNWDWMTYQAVATYDFTIAEKNNFTVMAGYEGQRYMYRYTTAFRDGGGDNALDQVLGSLNTNAWTNDDGGVDQTRQSWFGRIQYDFANRYLFEANFRADASSRFSKDNRWGYFPAVSAGWRISEESFMEASRGWLNQLKLRLGWGRTGNEELGDDYYPAIATYSFNPQLIGSTQYTGLYESRYVNQNLKWASVTNWELGVELSAFNNRLTFEGSIYKRKTNDMLLRLPILSVLGFDAPMQNAGSVGNKGVDITIGHNNRINKDWSYNVTFNMGFNQNKILNMSGTEGGINGKDSDLEWYLQGRPIGTYYGYVADGIFKDEAEVKAGPLRTGNEKPGNLRYKDWASYDENGKVVPIPDGKVTTADRKAIGKTAPSWMGGLNVGVNYRDFDFSMLWQGAFDYERYMTAEAAQAFYNGGTMNKWQMEQRWSPENPNGTYPRLYPNSSGSPDVNCNNSFWAQDASYVRLKNLTLGYTLPKALTQKAGINTVRVYFNGENLLTFSSIYKKGIDPEAPAGRGAYYANVRKLSLGLRLNF